MTLLGPSTRLDVSFSQQVPFFSVASILIRVGPVGASFLWCERDTKRNTHFLCEGGPNLSRFELPVRLGYCKARDNSGSKSGVKV